MMKHLKRFVAITISMVMAFQFCTNDFYLYAETEPADPGQTQVTNEPESGPSDSTEEAAEETPSSDTGTPEPSAPVEEQPAAPVEEQPAAPVEEQPEVASILKVEFVDANNASVKETVEQALESKYVGKTINLDELGIDTNVEGYTLTEVKDKNDNTQVYTTETKDFVLTGNVTELQFVYTQNVQTDQPENSQEPSTPQGGQEDQNSKEESDISKNKTSAKASTRSITGEQTVAVESSIVLSDDEGGWFDDWSFSGEGRVNIQADGKTATITGVTPGKVTITHSWGLGILSGSSTHKITVIHNVKVDSVDIQYEGQSVSELNLSTNDTVTLTAVVLPENATNKGVQWETTDSDVVSVENGEINALKAGEATVKVSSSENEEITDSIQIHVTDVEPESFTISAEGLTGETGTTYIDGTLQLVANFEPSNTTNKAVTWKSDNSDIATVDENGLIEGVSIGTTTIHATSVQNPSLSATYIVKVDEIMMTDFQVVTDDLDNTVIVGETLNVRAIIKPDDYPNKNVIWESNDPDIATVDENGVVTTHKPGEVIITGTSEADNTATSSVTIIVGKFR